MVSEKTDEIIEFEKFDSKTFVVGGILLCLSVIGIVFMIYEEIGVSPYVNAVLYSFATNCAISFFPHEVILIDYGKFMNLWVLAGLATVGSVIAGYFDYKFFTVTLNLPYSAKYKATKTYQKAEYWFNRFPFTSILIAGFTPVPFYPIKFMVFTTKYSFPKYLIGILISRFPRYYLIALGGFILNVPDWLIFASFALLLLVIYSKKMIQFARWLYLKIK